MSTDTIGEVIAGGISEAFCDPNNDERNAFTALQLLANNTHEIAEGIHSLANALHIIASKMKWDE